MSDAITNDTNNNDIQKPNIKDSHIAVFHPYIIQITGKQENEKIAPNDINNIEKSPTDFIPIIQTLICKP